MDNQTFEAVVTEVVSNLRHPFASAQVRSVPEGSLLTPGTSVTFSLIMAWEGKHDPLKDQVVVLSDVEEFAKGWRARVARPVSAITRQRNQEGKK